MEREKEGGKRRSDHQYNEIRSRSNGETNEKPMYLGKWYLGFGMNRLTKQWRQISLLLQMQN